MRLKVKDSQRRPACTLVWVGVYDDTGAELMVQRFEFPPGVSRQQQLDQIREFGQRALRQPPAPLPVGEEVIL